MTLTRFALFASLIALSPIGLNAAEALQQCVRPVKSCALCVTPEANSARCAPGEEARFGPPTSFDAEGCPKQCHSVSCAATPPPESERHRLLTENPHPWPAPTLRADHPRLFLDAAHLKRLRTHWTDPAYKSLADEYNNGNDPLSLALRGVAANDADSCRRAARAVAENDSPVLNLSSGPPGDTNMKLFGLPQTNYGDASALVFDWCYATLTPDIKAKLVAHIEQQNAMREAALNTKFQWHEAFYNGFHAYLMGVLAIEGEPGATHRLQKAQNALQNWTEMGNELDGDGSYKTYTHQDLFFFTPPILWSLATGQDVVRRNRFLLHHAEFLLRRLSPDGADFIAGPGDQSADARGMIITLQNPSPFGPLMLADYLHDGFAQWLGQFLLEKQGFGERVDNPRWLDLIFHDDALAPEPPVSAELPLTRYMREGGMVNVRSGWNIGQPRNEDIDAWFYLGPATAHAESDAGHFTLWRGADDLITEGSNYLGRPTKYHVLWSALSFARNTAVFSPAHGALPDLEGSQLPPPTMIYDDGRAFGSVGAQFLVDAVETADFKASQLKLTAEHHPVADRLIWYPGSVGYQGEITDFRDLGQVAIATGDAAAAYDPAHVVAYRRSFVAVKPDVFIIRDAFDLRDVGRIRMLFHHRERPDIAGFNAVKGSAEGGILEKRGDRITIYRGTSQAVIQLLSPGQATLRLVGGPGYDHYIDDTNIDARAGAAGWLNGQPDFPARLERVRGIWRSEIETDPATAGGEMVTAISVGPRGAAIPDIRLVKGVNGEAVQVARPDGTKIEVRLTDPKEPERDLAVCLAR